MNFWGEGKAIVVQPRWKTVEFPQKTKTGVRSSDSPAGPYPKEIHSMSPALGRVVRGGEMLAPSDGRVTYGKQYRVTLQNRQERGFSKLSPGNS